MLQQQQQRALVMAAQAQAQGGLLSSSPPRPASSTSNVGMGASIATNGQPHNHPMAMPSNQQALMLAQQMRINPQSMTQEQLNMYRQQQMRAMHMMQMQQQAQQQQNAQGVPNPTANALPSVPPSAS